MKSKTSWMNDERILLIIILFLSLLLLASESQAQQIERRIYNYAFIAHGANAPLSGPIEYSTIVSLNFKSGHHKVIYNDDSQVINLTQTTRAKYDYLEGVKYLAFEAVDQIGTKVYVGVFNDAFIMVTDEDFIMLTNTSNKQILRQ
jgi:hypothetical protein